MTLDEFFERLPRDGWEIWSNGYIRRGECCPITACDPESPPASHWREVKTLILADLDIETAKDIVDAADGWFGYRMALRARLLQHCGLTGKEVR